MAKIFISHASADKVIANQFYQLLLDALDLGESDIFFTSRPGGPLMDGELYSTINDQICECTSIIFLFSEGFLKSKDCKMEYETAVKRKKTKHALLLDGMSYNDLKNTSFSSSLSYCRPLNNKKNLITLLVQLSGELFQISPEDMPIETFKTKVTRYLRLGYYAGDDFTSGRISDSVYTNEEADRYIGNLESNYKQFNEAKYLLGCALFDGVLVKADEDRATRLIRECADYGYVPALLKLAYFYCRGVVRTGLLQFKEAFNCVRRAKEIDPYNPRVCVAMGQMYYYGVGCSRDLESAKNHFKIEKQVIDLESRGYFESLNKILKTPKSDLESAEIAASDGDPEGLYIAGLLYLTGGVGFEPDLDKAYDYLSRASKDIIAAEGMLGQFSYFGWGSIERNFEEAVVHFQKAAENGDTISQRVLGDLCKYGLLEGGWHKALDWYEMAAAQGDAKANLALAVMRGQYGYEFSYSEAFDHLKDAANGKEEGKADRDAQCVLGDVYKFGLLGQDLDLGSANYWYERARDNGSIVAELRLHPRFWE